MVARNSCNDAPSEPHIQELSWLTVNQLIKLEAVKAVYKALRKEAPLYIRVLFLRLSENQSSELPNFPIDLYSPRLRTSIGQKSFG